MKPRLWSYDDLCGKLQAAANQAKAEATRYPADAMMALAACRLWSARAEYALMHGAISESDFGDVDAKMNADLGIAMR